MFEEKDIENDIFDPTDHIPELNLPVQYYKAKLQNNYSEFNEKLS